VVTIRRLLHPVTAVVVLCVAALVVATLVVAALVTGAPAAGTAGGVALLLVAGAAAGFANSGST
jgi:methylthioribose-1-phosphate isomerase